MNRNDEFTEWMKELDGQIPEVGEFIRKGSRRKARKKFLYQPLMGLVAVFMLFVLSVNLCAPVAKAFSNVPVLKDLTKAVAFSKSLRVALENDYAQEVYLIQSKEGVTVEITSIVVDHQKLTVFYRVESEQYAGLQVYFDVPENWCNREGYCVEVINFYNEKEGVADGEVQYVAIDFFELYEHNRLPETLPLHMIVWNSEAYLEDVQAGVSLQGDDSMRWEEQAKKYAVANFDFELEPDWEMIPEAKKYTVNESLEFDGQKFMVKDIEVYPTYMDINMEAAGENTAQLVNLNFYVEDENGERFRDGCLGICGVGGRAGKEFWLRAESAYFYDGKISRMVVTGAVLLEEGKERTYINLTTGETKNLPGNETLKGIRKEDGKVYLDFEQKYLLRMDDKTGNPFGMPFYIARSVIYYDAEGKSYIGEIRGDHKKDENDYLIGEQGEYEMRLIDYPYEEVWLDNFYSDIWYADKEISIDIQ